MLPAVMVSVILSCPHLWGNPTGKTAKDLPVTWSTSSASVTRHSINFVSTGSIESAVLLEIHVHWARVEPPRAQVGNDATVTLA